MLTTNLTRIRCNKQEPLQQFIVPNNRPYNIRIFTKSTLTKETFIPLVTNWQNNTAKSGCSALSFPLVLGSFYAIIILFCVMPNGDGSAAHGSPQQSIPLGPWGVPDLHVTQTKQKHSATLLSGSAERERECKVVPKWMREKRKEG